jgi:S1-C subfamily serine protease
MDHGLPFRMPVWIDSVVKVAATVAEYDLDRPWVRGTKASHGAGVLVGPGRVLCTADVVTDALAVSVEGAAGRAEARVEAINHDCDLALLRVDAEVFAGRTPVVLGDLPELLDEVVVAGFTDDALAPELRRATVGRIAVERYVHSQRRLLSMRLDFGLDPTFGPGPVFRDGACIGLVVQKLTDDTACEAVPAPLIAAFLARRGAHVPALGITTQNLGNAELRVHVGAPAGVVVLVVDVGGSADGILRRGDVVVAIDGQPVSSQGTIALDGQVVGYEAALGTRAVGDRVALDIRRGGQPAGVTLVLKPWLPLVPRERHGRPPSYLVYAGLVFQPLTRDYLTTWEEWWNKGPKEFLHHYHLGRRTAAQHELIALTQILDDDATTGYGHLYNELVATVDGHVPRDLADLATRLDQAHGRVVIETTSGGLLAFDATAAHRATARVLERYEIASASVI